MKPDFYDDPVLARCSHSARLLFPALWQLADRSGVFEWDVAKIRKYAFGYDDVSIVDVSAWLCELAANGHIRQAVHEGKIWGLIPNLSKHQLFNRKEAARLEHVAKVATWGPAGGENSASTVSAPVKHGADTPVFCSSVNGVLLTVDREVTTSAGPQTKRTPRKRSPEAAPSGVAIVRGVYLKCYEATYGRAGVWGARQAGQCAQLAGQVSFAEQAELLPMFFRWQNPRVIADGHSYGRGPQSFVMQVERLRADLAKNRRGEIGAARAAERHDEQSGAIDDAVAGAIAILEQRGAGDVPS